MAAILENLWQWSQHAPVPVLALATLFVILVSHVLLNSFRNKGDQKEDKPPPPPSPWALPVIGNMHQLLGTPHRSLASLARKYGPLMTFRLGSAKYLVISTAAAAAEVLKTHDKQFCSRPHLTSCDRLLYDSRDIVMSPYGERWRQSRRVCVLHLLSSTRVNQMCGVREEEVVMMLGKIAERAKSGEKVNVSAALLELTNNVVGRTVLGKSYRRDEDMVESSTAGVRMRELVPEFLDLLGSPKIAYFLPSLEWINRISGYDARVAKVAKDIDAVLEKEIQDRLRTRQSSGGHGATDENFVDVLLSVEAAADKDYALFDRNAIKALLLDMFAAGIHTTSTAMDWTMTELMRHPQVRAKLTQEIRSTCTYRDPSKNLIVEDDIVDRLPYLNSVIKEVLRMHPPFPMLVPRETIADVEVMGKHVPSGTTVLINAWAIHHDPDNWESPHEFRPERFSVDGAAAVDFKGNDFRFIPFGSGRRGCPGTLFSSRIVHLAIANLLFHFDLELPQGMDSSNLDMSEAVGFATNRRYSLGVVATPV